MNPAEGAVTGPGASSGPLELCQGRALYSCMCVSGTESRTPRRRGQDPQQCTVQCQDSTALALPVPVTPVPLVGACTGPLSWHQKQPLTPMQPPCPLLRPCNFRACSAPPRALWSFGPPLALAQGQTRARALQHMLSHSSKLTQTACAPTQTACAQPQHGHAQLEHVHGQQV